jgi:pyruvate formate lyase activating enzyme
MLIGGVEKTSLLDYPEKLTAVVFTIGCNFRCGYCHNPELVKLKEDSKTLDEADFFAYLEKRKGLLDAVTITGGEPTLQTDLYEFIKKIKDMGYLVKLDTNGTNPEILEKLLAENLLDYIAMDIKNSIENYNKVVRNFITQEKILKSISLIMNSGVDYEFRTTVLKCLISIEDFEKIGETIKGAKKYFIQKFIPTKILNENLMNEINYTNEEFENIKTKMEKYVNFVSIR